MRLLYACAKRVDAAFNEQPELRIVLGESINFIQRCDDVVENNEIHIYFPTRFYFLFVQSVFSHCRLVTANKNVIFTL